MAIKKLGLFTSIPLVASAVIGFTGSANAASFEGEVQIGGPIGLRIVPGDPNESVLFSPIGGDFSSFAPVGSTAVAEASGPASGTFDTYNTVPPASGTILSFDNTTFDNDASIGSPLSDFIVIPAGSGGAGDLPGGFTFDLEEFNTVGGTNTSIDIVGFGTFRDPNGVLDDTRGTFEFTAQGFNFSNGDFEGSLSNTIIARADIPEPTSVLGLLALSTMLGFSSILKRKQPSNSGA